MMPPALRDMWESLTPTERKLCERITTDKWPERFQVSLDRSQFWHGDGPRFIFGAVLINDWPLERIERYYQDYRESWHPIAEQPNAVAYFRATLAEVERLHA